MAPWGRVNQVPHEQIVILYVKLTTHQSAKSAEKESLPYAERNYSYLNDIFGSSYLHVCAHIMYAVNNNGRFGTTPI